MLEVLWLGWGHPIPKLTSRKSANKKVKLKSAVVPFSEQLKKVIQFAEIEVNRNDLLKIFLWHITSRQELNSAVKIK